MEAQPKRSHFGCQLLRIVRDSASVQPSYGFPAAPLRATRARTNSAGCDRFSLVAACRAGLPKPAARIGGDRHPRPTIGGRTNVPRSYLPKHEVARGGGLWYPLGNILKGDDGEEYAAHRPAEREGHRLRALPGARGGSSPPSRRAEGEADS